MNRRQLLTLLAVFLAAAATAGALWYLFAVLPGLIVSRWE